MKIRRLTHEERCADKSLSVLTEMILAILLENYEETPWSARYIVADLANVHSHYFLAELNEKVIGFLAISSFMDEIEITNIAVLPEFQGHGVASQLLTELSVFTGTIFLEVRESNHVAQKLYEKFEFKTYHIRKNYYDKPRENALLMKKEQF